MKFSDVVVNRSRVSDQIKDALKNAILSGEFKPGDKLPVKTKSRRHSR